LPIGVIRWLTNEPAKIAGTIQIEGKVTTLHTVVQNKGVLNTGEVTRAGGRRDKKGFPKCRIYAHQRSLLNVTSSNMFLSITLGC